MNRKKIDIRDCAGDIIRAMNDVWKPGVKEMLDDMHLRKIDMADEIFVINVGGYIGESTKREIAYAEQKGKKVNYLES